MDKRMQDKVAIITGAGSGDTGITGSGLYKQRNIGKNVHKSEYSKNTHGEYLSEDRRQKPYSSVVGFTGEKIEIHSSYKFIQSVCRRSLSAGKRGNMEYRRYLVEFDSGVDLHGMDYTKAAKKAVKNAISHCCLCGLQDLLHCDDMNAAMKVSVKIGSPDPEAIDKREVLEQIPFGTKEIEIVSGGLAGKGLCVPALGCGDTIVIVNALLTVWVDTDLISIH